MQPVLYAFRLPDPIPFEDYETLLTILSPHERDRVQRYRLSEDRLRSLISRLALWYHLLITDLLRPSDNAPTFRSGPRGKPYLVSPITRHHAPTAGTGGPTGSSENVHIGFNVSHEGQWVLLGVLERVIGTDEASQSVTTPAAPEVGVDVMVPPSDPFDLKEALIPQMTIRERQALSILLSATQLRWTLSSLWALKEGYTKAVGDGVGFGLDRIQVKFGDPPRLPDKASIGPTGQSISPRREQVSHARFSGETEASLPVLGVKMEASLPVLGVKVDGVNVRQAGWDWAIGTVGTAGSWDQVGWAMYWQDREDQDRVRETADVGVGAEGGGQGARPRVEVVEWDDLIRVFDRLPSYKSRSSS